MDEYISKQLVLDYLNGYLHSIGEDRADSILFDRGQRRALINTIQDLMAAKAADVRPVKHGHWLICSDGYYPYCSECGHWPKEMSKFCEECGADMREEGKK